MYTVPSRPSAAVDTMLLPVEKAQIRAPVETETHRIVPLVRPITTYPLDEITGDVITGPDAVSLQRSTTVGPKGPTKADWSEC